MSSLSLGSSFFDENPAQAMATPAKQTFGPKRAFGDDITNSSKKDLKGTRTPMQQTSFTPRQSSAGLSSFPKSLSKAAASSSKVAPAEIADVEHATRRAQPEACFDPAVTKVVSLLAASTCTPNDVLSQCIPSSCVQDAQSLEDLLAMKDLCDTLSFSDDDDCCPAVPPSSRACVYDLNF